MPDVTETYSQPKVEAEWDWQVPSAYTKCRGGRGGCPNAPVADMLRKRHHRASRSIGGAWWAYCADHLHGYNREVRDGRVWWRGYQEAPHA